MKQVQQLTWAAIFVALSLVLPYATLQLPQLGNALLPMHLPVLLCGALCGWRYGGLVGALSPLLRSVLFGMPVLFPTAVAMSFELAGYGITMGICCVVLNYRKADIALWKRMGRLYIALILAMLLGRIVWGGVMTVFFSGGMTGGDSFSGWELLQWIYTEAVLTAIPGIVLQLVLVPTLLAGSRKMKDTAFPKQRMCNAIGKKNEPEQNDTTACNSETTSHW